MTFFQALILGIIQGIAEFLPISSSGHLKIGQIFFGFNNLEQLVLFDLVCHFGTLLAIFAILTKEMRGLWASDRPKLFTLALATLPLFLLVPFLKEVKLLIDTPSLLGGFFLITSLFLFLGERSERSIEQRGWNRRDAMMIGCTQALAVLPGISRSGSMIATARILGWEQADAIRFAVLMAVPAILGGIGLESIEIIMGSVMIPEISWFYYFVGLSASFFTGAAVLHYLLTKIPDRGYFRPFKWYCLFLGILLLVLLNL